MSKSKKAVKKAASIFPLHNPTPRKVDGTKKTYRVRWIDLARRFFPAAAKRGWLP